MPQVLAKSLSRCGRSARCSSAKTSIALDRDLMLDAFGLSSAELAEWVEDAVILSLYVIFLRLTADVSPVTISLGAILFHCMK